MTKGTTLTDDHNVIRQFVAAILGRAVEDWKTKKEMRMELIVFFHSKFFYLCCEGLDLDPAVVQERLGVPDDTN